MSSPDPSLGDHPDEERRGDAGSDRGGAAGGGPSAGGAPGAVPGDDGHPSEEAVDALLDADLVEVRDRGGREGAGTPPEALAAAHVLGCERCQAVLADMRAVRGLLRRQGSGTPPPPVDLTARIAAAVAEDAARERRAARARRRRSVLALAASAVVVGGLGTALALQVHQAQTGSAGSAAADAGSAVVVDGAAPLVMASGTDYSLGSLGDQLHALLDDPATPPGSGAGAGPGTAQEDLPGADGNPAGPAARAPDAAARGDRAGGAEAGPGAAAPTTPSGLARPEDLGTCLTALGRAGAEVVAVDTALWEGRPADLLVLHERAADAGASPGLAVWVVRTGCSGGQDGLLHYEVVEP